eukprot:CAMPEP_0170247306 /NCGR_PEP_ID=MMETSP0116_2-20130129/23441_1 /TAXON_ID=400756 /ORGANISM="Durinskia baltica, Strain CSIRO CS-38" /LENGTH=921 /DNA_ID=CAMNT_0010498185 /DNA_START=138 /DNA_END=2900 /DNA_ORIENTATION=+
MRLQPFIFRTFDPVVSNSGHSLVSLARSAAVSSPVTPRDRARQPTVGDRQRGLHLCDPMEVRSVLPQRLRPPSPCNLTQEQPHYRPWHWRALGMHRVEALPPIASYKSMCFPPPGRDEPDFGEHEGARSDAVSQATSDLIAAIRTHRQGLSRAGGNQGVGGPGVVRGLATFGTTSSMAGSPADFQEDHEPKVTFESLCMQREDLRSAAVEEEETKQQRVAEIMEREEQKSALVMQTLMRGLVARRRFRKLLEASRRPIEEENARLWQEMRKARPVRRVCDLETEMLKALRRRCGMDSAGDATSATDAAQQAEAAETAAAATSVTITLAIEGLDCQGLEDGSLQAQQCLVRIKEAVEKVVAIETAGVVICMDPSDESASAELECDGHDATLSARRVSVSELSSLQVTVVPQRGVTPLNALEGLRRCQALDTQVRLELMRINGLEDYMLGGLTIEVLDIRLSNASVGNASICRTNTMRTRLDSAAFGSNSRLQEVMDIIGPEVRDSFSHRGSGDPPDEANADSEALEAEYPQRPSALDESVAVAAPAAEYAAALAVERGLRDDERYNVPSPPTSVPSSPERAGATTSQRTVCRPPPDCFTLLSAFAAVAGSQVTQFRALEGGASPTSGKSSPPVAGGHDGNLRQASKGTNIAHHDLVLPSMRLAFELQAAESLRKLFETPLSWAPSPDEPLEAELASSVRQRYIESCSAWHVKPNSQALHRIGQVSIVVGVDGELDSTYDFSTSHLGDRGAISLLHALAADPYCARVSLASCGLRRASAPSLAVFLELHQRLRDLDLSDNSLSFEAGEAILEGLNRRTVVRRKGSEAMVSSSVRKSFMERRKRASLIINLIATPLAWDKSSGFTVGPPSGSLWASEGLRTARFAPSGYERLRCELDGSRKIVYVSTASRSPSPHLSHCRRGSA